MTGSTRTYLDWAATAPLCKEAADAMTKSISPWPHAGLASWNPNSVHSEGRAAFSAMEQARKEVASTIGARPDEVIFTGSATESDYLAVLGLTKAAIQKRRLDFSDASIVISALEHDAVIQAAKEVSRMGVDVIYVHPCADGRITPEAVEQVLTDSTVLVSIMMANNEIGVVQPIADITKVVHQSGALMHTDAVQALGKMPLSCHDLGVDAASISSHKIGGPKGIGALYVRAGTSIEPLMAGGGQERGLRGGTQDVASMAGFAAACLATCASPSMVEQEATRLRKLRDTLYTRMCAHSMVHQTVPCEIDSKAYVPTIAHVCVEGFESETLILQLDIAGFAVSSGSACSSHSLEPSRILRELGIEHDLALGSLRVSIGRYTTEEDVDAFLTTFERIISQ